MDCCLRRHRVGFVFSLSTDQGQPHPLADELLFGLGEVNEEGAAVDVAAPSRYIAVERPGVPRRLYQVTHCTGQGGQDGPYILEVHCEDMLSKLNRLVAFSAPTTVTGQYTRFTRDWVGDEHEGALFRQPRDLSDMKMVTVADGITLDGQAEEVIRRVIRDAVAADARARGVTSPIVVSTKTSGVPSPYLAFTPGDGHLWDEIGALCMQAGVQVDVELWWPSDRKPAGVSQALTMPTLVVHVTQDQEVKSSGSA